MHNAFTTRYLGLARVLTTEVGVCVPLTLEEARKQSDFKIVRRVAIWDTGATNSCITKKIADELGLKPTGVVEVMHAKGKSLTNTYLVNLTLPSNVMVGQIRVTEVELIPDSNVPENLQPQLLIGMDVINMGDFAVTNANGKTSLSFHVPPIKEIDFIPAAEDNNIRETGGNRHERRALKAALRKQH